MILVQSGKMLSINTESIVVVVFLPHWCKQINHLMKLQLRI